MRAMRQAMHISPASTLTALKVFICSRLAPEVRTSTTEDTAMKTWLEKATVTYMMFATSSPKVDVVAIKELLDEISSTHQVLFSAKATHAAQTLLWKVAGDVETWTSCQLLQHPLFFNAGHLNKARVGR